MRRLKILWLGKSGSLGFLSFFLKHLGKQDYQCAGDFHHGEGYN